MSRYLIKSRALKVGFFSSPQRPIFLHMYTTCSKLPSNKGIMLFSHLDASYSVNKQPSMLLMYVSNDILQHVPENCTAHPCWYMHKCLNYFGGYPWKTRPSSELLKSRWRLIINCLLDVQDPFKCIYLPCTKAELQLL